MVTGAKLTRQKRAAKAQRGRRRALRRGGRRRARRGGAAVLPLLAACVDRLAPCPAAEARRSAWRRWITRCAAASAGGATWEPRGSPDAEPPGEAHRAALSAACGGTVWCGAAAVTEALRAGSGPLPRLVVASLGQVASVLTQHLPSLGVELLWARDGARTLGSALGCSRPVAAAGFAACPAELLGSPG
eukprot:TRINITY_DN8125_c0_g1_i2.p3 TRINITY_DN8125_c0_g1~~TRINITY_DN8125_c0_g1_i2.p3  ORF type:complete len:213 (+),score=46.46 TRINITY_DN8125_c0_g1_i2:74-640(+)